MTAAICFVAFLPDILDSKAEGRNKYIAILQTVAEKYKRSPYRQVPVLLFILPISNILNLIFFKAGFYKDFLRFLLIKK